MVAVCGVVTVKQQQQKPFTSQEIRKIGKDSDCDQYDDDDEEEDDNGNNGDEEDDDDDDDDDALCYIVNELFEKTNIFDGWDDVGLKIDAKA